MSGLRLILVRHAEVEAPYQRVFGGRIDMGLSPRGHEQARALAEFLAFHAPVLDAVYASPMRRVQQTLTPFQNNGAPQPTVLAELREVDFGDWTGLTYEQVLERFGVSADAWLDQLCADAIPNAEKSAAYRARIAAGLQRILIAHPRGHVAVFCHGGVIRMMLALLLELPFAKTAAFQIDYASVTELSLSPGRVRLEFLNLVPWRLDTAPATASSRLENSGQHDVRGG
ncbi:MAG: histidine phosphatase family protein [Verrucomicrobiae bacterium]|nr:histidine phosphatase family protein [Verrucomicrobiae bacterium]